MVPAALLAILASLSWGLADFLGGLSARRLPVFTVLVVSQPAGLFVLLAVSSWRGLALPHGQSTLWAIGAGFASIFSLAMLYLAAAIGRMVLVAPLAATGVSVPVSIGVLTGNAITPALVIGGILAIVGTLAVTLGGGSDGEAERSRHDRRSDLLAAACALGSAAGQGCFLTFLNQASKDSNAFGATITMRVTASMLTVLLFIGYFLLRRRTTVPTHVPCEGDVDWAAAALPEAAPVQLLTDDRRLTRARSPETRAQPERVSPVGQFSVRRIVALAVVGAGIADGLAEFSFASASTHGGLSTIAVLSEQYPTITMLLALTLLHERAKAIQFIGALSALTGVVLISTLS